MLRALILYVGDGAYSLTSAPYDFTVFCTGIRTRATATSRNLCLRKFSERIYIYYIFGHYETSVRSVQIKQSSGSDVYIVAPSLLTAEIGT